MNRSIVGLRKVAERVQLRVQSSYGRSLDETNISHLNTPSTQDMSVRLRCFPLLFAHLTAIYTTELCRDG